MLPSALKAVAADIARDLGEPGVVILGLVHILVYDSYIKVGQSDDMTPQLLRRLTKYRQHSMADEARLAFPSIYVATSGEQASLLEGFRHMHMSANHPDFRLDLLQTQFLKSVVRNMTGGLSTF